MFSAEYIAEFFRTYKLGWFAGTIGQAFYRYAKLGYYNDPEFEELYSASDIRAVELINSWRM